MSTTVGFNRSVCQAIGMVGRHVTYAQRQFVVHSVEGPDWYAFADRRQGEEITTVDCSMTVAHWIKEPVATIIPTDGKIGDGRGVEIPLQYVRPGVCLAKSYR